LSVTGLNKKPRSRYAKIEVSGAPLNTKTHAEEYVDYGVEVDFSKSEENNETNGKCVGGFKRNRNVDVAVNCIGGLGCAMSSVTSFKDPEAGDSDTPRLLFWHPTFRFLIVPQQNSHKYGDTFLQLFFDPIRGVFQSRFNGPIVKSVRIIFPDSVSPKTPT
jgi:hypothetical protein